MSHGGVRPPHRCIAPPSLINGSPPFSHKVLVKPPFSHHQLCLPYLIEQLLDLGLDPVPLEPYEHLLLHGRLVLLAQLHQRRLVAVEVTAQTAQVLGDTKRGEEGSLAHSESLPT